MAQVIYTFYVETDLQAGTALTPQFSSFIDIGNGTTFGTLPAITELSAGFYKFTFDWSLVSNSAGYLIKIDTGLASDEAQRYIIMRIEPHDHLAASADSIQTSANTISSYAKRILDIESGTWKIEGTELVLYSAGFGVAADTVIARYELQDSAGVATATNPHRRVLTSLTAI